MAEYALINKSELSRLIGIPASVGVCEPVEGFAERPDLLPGCVRDMAKEITRLQSELEKTEALEMASCLGECLEDVNEAIRATMRSGNGGKLWVDGKELSTHQVADRLESLMIKRDRILKALKPLKVDVLKHPDIPQQHCTYPTCHCPFDRGSDFFCLRGLPEKPDPNKS